MGDDFLDFSKQAASKVIKIPKFKDCLS